MLALHTFIIYVLPIDKARISDLKNNSIKNLKIKLTPFGLQYSVAFMNKQIPKDSRGRPMKTNVIKMKIGDRVKASSSSACYWNKIFPAMRFTVRGTFVYRTK
jgi:hypothetical protein